jgi:hypothetical protein
MDASELRAFPIGLRDAGGAAAGCKFHIRS